MFSRTMTFVASMAFALVLGAASAHAEYTEYTVLWFNNSPTTGGWPSDAMRKEMSDYLDALPLFESTYASSQISGDLAALLLADDYDVLVFDSARWASTLNAADHAAITAHYTAKPHLLLDSTLAIRSTDFNSSTDFPGINGSTGNITANEIWQLAARGGGILIGADHDSTQVASNDALAQCIPGAAFSGWTTPSLDGLFNSTHLTSSLEVCAPGDLLAHWQSVASMGIAPTGSFTDVNGDPVELFSQVEIANEPGGGTKLCHIASTWDPSDDIPLVDCNGNGVMDLIEIANDPLLDANNNCVIDTCETCEAPALLGITGDTTTSSTLWDIDTENGAPTNPRTVSAAPDRGPSSIACAPSGVLYGISHGSPLGSIPDTGKLYTINPTSGAATFVADLTPTHFINVEGDIAVDPTTGTLYAVDGQGFLFTISTTSGVGTTIGNLPQDLPGGADYSGMAFNGSGQLFVWSTFGQVLREVDKSNADIISTVSLSSSAGGSIGGLAFAYDTGTAYIAGGSGASAMLSTVITNSGAVTSVGPLTGMNGVFAIASCCVPQSGWSTVGGGLTGTGGLLPELAGAGTVSGGDVQTVTLTDALPGATAWFVVGTSNLGAAFKQGTLIPSPDVVMPVSVDPAGRITFGFTWPTGVPSGVSVYYQYWITDPAGPVGFSASNGLQSTTP